MIASLWNLSAYSLLQSVCRIETLVATAKMDGQPAIGLCDRNVLSGAVQFYQACERANIKPLIGMSVSDGEGEIILYAQNQQGYASLVNISTAIQLGNQPFATLSHQLHGVALILPTSHQLLQTALEKRDFTPVNELIERYRQFGATCYLGVVGETGLQHQFEFWHQLCQQSELTPLAIHQTTIHEPQQAAALAVVQAIGSGQKTTLDSINQHRVHDVSQWSSQQYEIAFQAWPQAVANTLEFAQTCNVTFDFDARFLPAYPLPNGVDSVALYLQSLCVAGLKKRYGQIQQHQYERLQYELKVIDDMDFNDYFLIVWDFIKYARSQNIAIGPGRGSAVGSLVAYCLGITNCDPLTYGLLFERFLNPERISMPDIDIDIEDERRQEVIDYVRIKYGEDRVVQIATFGTFATKAAFREVARILDATSEQLNTISKILPHSAAVDNLAHAYASVPAFTKLINGNAFLNQAFQIAKQIEGLPRNVSTHAAGIIIGAESLHGVIPLQTGMGATAATQYTMNELEALGMLKMDFLGLRNLSLIKRVVARVEAESGQPFFLQNIPLDEPRVYAMLQQAQTTGIFQLESGGMRAALRQIQPTQFEDIVATLALFRPGPMENIPVYSRRKQGLEPVSFPDERLREILAPTYGIIIYQEQIMQIATQLAGYSLGEADILRRAISKKKESILADERERFVSKSVAQGVKRASADAIYDLIVKFANYGFNKSHAVAYSLIAYQLAYLKMNYPTFFWCELLNSVISSENKIAEYLQALKQQQIAIIKPSIQTGGSHFQVVNGKLQLGMLMIKNVGLAVVQAILALRDELSFTDFETTIKRLKNHRALTKATLTALIDAGAFDDFGITHASMLHELEHAKNQMELDLLNFAGGAKFSVQAPSLPELHASELMSRELACFGFYLFTHPIIALRKQYPHSLEVMQVAKFAGKQVQILVYIEKIRSVKTKTGETMVFISASDESANIELVAFPKVFSTYAECLQVGALLLVKGKVEQRQNQIQIVVYEVQKLEK